MPDIPPDLMKLMQGGGNPPGQPPMPGGGAPDQGPTSSPMSTPQPNEGEKQGAMAQVQMAIDLMEQTLKAFGSETEEGQTILNALQTLTKTFGDKKEKSRGLIPSEIMNLVSSLPKGAGGMQPPGAGASPPGAPPGAQPPGGMPPMQ